jgi:hypothetical protein
MKQDDIKIYILIFVFFSLYNTIKKKDVKINNIWSGGVLLILLIFFSITIFKKYNLIDLEKLKKKYRIVELYTNMKENAWFRRFRTALTIGIVQTAITGNISIDNFTNISSNHILLHSARGLTEYLLPYK